jgi:Right handed beta helix region/Fibronectin type III domain
VRASLTAAALIILAAATAALGWRPAAAQIAAATMLSAKAVSSSEVDLSWHAASASVSKYRVFRDGVPIAVIDGGRMSYRDTDLAPSTTYTDTVVALDASGAASKPSAPASATTAVVPGRHPGIASKPQGAIVFNVGDRLQKIVNAYPPNTTFYFSPGIYRLDTAIRPKSGDVFEGAPGAILNGARLLVSFTREGLYYVTSDVPQQTRGNTAGSCAPNHRLCKYVQDLYFDDRPLTPVSNLSQLSSGKWFFDRDSSRVFLYDNPSGHKVEIGFAYAAFDNPAATRVTIDGFTVEKFATEGQFGAIGFHVPGTGWIVEDNEVRLNHAAGININTDGVVRGNYVHDNGEKGITGGNANNVLVINNEMSFNNYAGYTCDWECGGLKFGATTNSTFSGNYAHDNLGVMDNGAPGLWCDVDCMNVTFKNNVAANNGGNGITYEISHYGTFMYNIIENNGAQNAGWGWGSGLQINESDHVTAFGNLLMGNHNGIIGVQQRRGSGPFGTYALSDLYVHDNLTIIAASDPGAPGRAAGIFQDMGDYAVFTSRHNRFARNTYRGLRANRKPFEWKSGAVTPTQWQEYGNDTDGRFEK